MRSRTANHYRDLLARNPSASIGFTLAASAVYAARYGVCEADHHATPEWHEIASAVKARYGENLTVAEVIAAMDAKAQP
jgi:hypothetical protein